MNPLGMDNTALDDLQIDVSSKNVWIMIEAALVAGTDVLSISLSISLSLPLPHTSSSGPSYAKALNITKTTGAASICQASRDSEGRNCVCLNR